MCDLVSGIMAASAAVGAYGQVQAGNAAAQAAMVSQQINMTNAAFAERRARDALMRGQEEEQRLRREGAQLKGQQIAQMGAANIDLGYGSPLDVLIDTTTGIELDAARLRRNAQLEAEDFETQAWSYRAQGGLDGQRARNDRRAGVIGAAGSLLSGGGQIGQYRARVSIA